MELSKNHLDIKALKSAILQSRYSAATLVKKEILIFFFAIEKKNKSVEFSFRDFNKAMGISTYKTSSTLPKAYKGLIPDVEAFKKLMD